MTSIRSSFLRRLSDFPAPTPQPTPCRLWQGRVTKHGYGMRPDNSYIHRWVWAQVNGAIPSGVRVLHRCDNPPCYRYDHLFAGTAKDNTADMMAKGRWVQGPPLQRGSANPRSKLTEPQVLAIRSRAGEPTRVLAKEYGVSMTTILDVLARQTWGHI
jgi:hypothetical protein